MSCSSRLVAIAVHIEAYSLGQGQIFAPIDGVRLAPHVGLPGIGAGLTAAAGVFLTAERAADFSSGSADVDVGDAAIAARGRQKSLRALHAVGKYRRR